MTFAFEKLLRNFCRTADWELIVGMCWNLWTENYVAITSWFTSNWAGHMVVAVKDVNIVPAFTVYYSTGHCFN